MRLHSDDFEASESGEDSDTREIERRDPPRFSHRHGLKILGGILATMFVSVIAVQVAC